MKNESWVKNESSSSDENIERGDLVIHFEVKEAEDIPKEIREKIREKVFGIELADRDEGLKPLKPHVQNRIN